MAHFLEHAANVATVIATLAAVSTGPAVGRALALALRSRLARAPSPQSARAADVLALRDTLASTSPGRYVVVQGPKGVGKTCVVETALQRTCGVVVVEVAPGAPHNAIVSSALASIVGIRSNWWDPRPSALHVLWWYRWLLPPPIIVLRVSERPAGKEYPGTAGAVRSLVDCGFRAVIDSPPDSLEPGTLATLRQAVIELGPMPRALLFSLPEHAALFAALRKADLEDVVWAVLGGVPAHYTALHDMLRSLATPDEFGRSVEAYVRAELRGAITRRANMLVAHPFMAPILDEFRRADEVAESRLRDVVRPSPNTVLRSVAAQGGKATVFIPADSAMALVLRHRFEVAPSLGELRALCAEERSPPAPSSVKAATDAR